MFDIGFWEIMMIAVIGIVVVGPDKLPEVARSVVIFFRKFRRLFNDVKDDIERELHLDEIRETIEDAEVNMYLEDFHQSNQDIEESVKRTGKQMFADIDMAAYQNHYEPLESIHHPEDYRDTGVESINVNDGLNNKENQEND